MSSTLDSAAGPYDHSPQSIRFEKISSDVQGIVRVLVSKLFQILRHLTGKHITVMQWDSVRFTLVHIFDERACAVVTNRVVPLWLRCQALSLFNELSKYLRVIRRWNF